MDTLRLPDYVNVKDFLAGKFSPVVVLTDFRKTLKKLPFDVSLKFPSDTRPPTSNPTPPTSLPTPEPSPEPSPKPSTPVATSAPLLPTPEPSPPPSAPQTPSQKKRKRQSWDPSVEYEIEKILGYHRDKKSRMLYFVKWKDWSDEHNTFEPIDNLTGCHYKLMKYFESQRPTREDLRRKKLEVKEGLKKRGMYMRMKAEGCRSSDLEEFSRKCMDLRPLFETNDLAALERDTRREYEYIIRCLIGMYSHQDPGLLKRAENYKLFLKLVKLRRLQVQRNEKEEKRINSVEKALVKIENKVDLEPFPEIEYIVEMKPGEGVVVPKEPLLGCECPGGCSPKSRCCGVLGDSQFAYGTNGKLRTCERVAIYECNSRCGCPPTCGNRVVQHGRQVKLCVFKTEKCGWGVKALERIPKGTFVCQYLGELIPDSLAGERDVKYSKEKRTGYLFDLDFFEDAQLDLYCIDATEQGNIARFINHSCDPNLMVYPVWIDRLEPNLHLLAFFAKKNIQANEEIHFDYENREELPSEDVQSRRVRQTGALRCVCNAPNCRQWVFGIGTSR